MLEFPPPPKTICKRAAGWNFSIYMFSLFWKENTAALCLTHIFHLELLLSQTENHSLRGLTIPFIFFIAQLQVEMEVEQNLCSNNILGLKINSGT